MKSRYLPALVLFLLAWSLPANSQDWENDAGTLPQMFSIRGTLRFDRDQTPANMTKVTLLRATNQVAADAFTNANGEFQFLNLGRGTYILVVDEKGYQPVRETVEIRNMSLIAVSLSLRQAASLSAGLAPSVSVRELKIPNAALEAFRKGMRQLHENNDPASSLRYFSRAVSAFPDYYEAYYETGMAKMNLGKQQEAEEALRKSIALSQGRYPEAQFALGGLLVRSQKFSEAEGVLRRGLELDSGSWQGHYELARALLGQNRVREAQKNAEEASAARPDFAPLHLLLADIHIREHDYAALLKDLDEYLLLEPNGALSARARAMREQARRSLASARNASPPDVPKP